MDGRLRLSQLRALRTLGLDRDQRRVFLSGAMSLYYFSTQSEPAIAIVQLVGSRLRSGIIDIRDVGGGVNDLVRFRTASQQVARAFGAAELELFGGAIINPRLEALLLRQGFCNATAPVPDELGGGTIDVVTRVFPLR